jgi:phosphopantothenoylcysteine synthetase/decarboxylase
MFPMLDYIKANSDQVQSEEELLEDYFIDYTEQEKEEYEHDKKQLGRDLMAKFLQKNWKQLLAKIQIAAI